MREGVHVGDERREREGSTLNNATELNAVVQLV